MLVDVALVLLGAFIDCTLWQIRKATVAWLLDQRDAFIRAT